MSIYIDDEFDATTLAELEQQVLERAREEWKRHVEDEALCTYRRLAIQEGLIEEPKPGLFDLVSPHLQELWGKSIARHATERYMLDSAGFRYIDHAAKLTKGDPMSPESETNVPAPAPSPVPAAQFPPHYTAEDLIGLLSRQESVNLDRLAATLAHSLQTSALVVDWVNKQILKERAEQQAQAQAAKDQVEAPAPEPETTTDANTDDGSTDYGARTRRRK